MLSSVLLSERAIRVNIDIMRAFVSLCGLLASNNELAGKLAVLERKYDSQFKVVFAEQKLQKLAEIGTATFYYFISEQELGQPLFISYFLLWMSPN